MFTRFRQKNDEKQALHTKIKNSKTKHAMEVVFTGNLIYTLICTTRYRNTPNVLKFWLNFGVLFSSLTQNRLKKWRPKTRATLFLCVRVTTFFLNFAKSLIFICFFWLSKEKYRVPCKISDFFRKNITRLFTSGLWLKRNCDRERSFLYYVLRFYTVWWLLSK